MRTAPWSFGLEGERLMPSITATFAFGRSAKPASSRIGGTPASSLTGQARLAMW